MTILPVAAMPDTSRTTANYWAGVSAAWVAFIDQYLVAPVAPPEGTASAIGLFLYRVQIEVVSAKAQQASSPISTLEARSYRALAFEVLTALDPPLHEPTDATLETCMERYIREVRLLRAEFDSRLISANCLQEMRVFFRMLQRLGEHERAAIHARGSSRA